jgi:RHS repeat-associated protein
MTKDGLNSLQLEYNFLNLTGKVSDMSGNALANYSWLADGTKTGVRDATGTSGYEYIGSLVYKYVNGELQLESAGFGGGRIEVSNGSDGNIYTPNYYITDHLGSTRAIVTPDEVNGGLAVVERVNFTPFGTKWTDGQAPTSRYMFTGYEDQPLLDNKYVDANARFYNYLRFNTPDPFAGDRPWESPYAYAGNNPIRNVDPTGLAWRPTYYDEEDDDDEGDDPQRVISGFTWVEEDESYNEDGTLKDGLYSQAIFFSHNGTFDATSNKNIGSSTASVFLEDGTIKTFEASTYPSDLDDYATVPEGQYEAIVGKHKGRYEALRMSDDGTYNGTIELGGPNPSAPSRTYAQGINIHKPGRNNETGKDSRGNAYSAGCFLIDINNWDSFIGKFDNPTQRRNTVGIINSRTHPRPVLFESFSSYYNRPR